ncbi:hypothetical protein FE783_21125 [Paenibacillus mesophilus]|uniref:NeuD/PglB/VioB family sugar acetyltransferase n=1 Tax=Paenibacillus mesophilus TaxID=2582849 RepID=UPI00110DED64|nr:NeuD/PglB/VioB family sugar acetyltransferase [Paenibacillus mesophilus]TMV47506.1 hypothetical protein FE783_21125 [Paenibacillus mesophilus]
MKKTKKEIVIIGAGGLGKGIAQLIKDINHSTDTWELLGFMDDDVKLAGKAINGYPVLGKLELLGEQRYRDVHTISAIGNSEGRIHIIRKARGINPSMRTPTLVHPTAVVGDETSIGEGTAISAYTVIEADNRIGEHVLVHFGSTIGHDCEIEDFSTILPGANVSGRVRLRIGSYLGTNSSVLPGVEVGPYSVVGAGAVVVRSLPGYCTAVGVPAKLIKYAKK